MRTNKYNYTEAFSRLLCENPDQAKELLEELTDIFVAATEI